MKKIKTFFFVLAFSLIGAYSFAQSFNGGLIAGATFCQIDGDSLAGYHQLGLTTGVYANLPLSEHLSGQLELKYSLFGAHTSTYEITERVPVLRPYSIRLHYAEVPLMLRYDLGQIRISDRPLDFIILELGVSLDFRFRATEDADTDFQVTTYRWNFFSATGNVGVHFAFNKHWGMGARWMYSIVPCRFRGNPRWFLDHYYNKVWQLTFTYNINSPVR